MIISLFLRGTILTLFLCCFSAIAQDYTQFSLPKGAIARFGKGTLGKIHFSPDGSRLAVSSSIGIWFYDPQTGKTLRLLTYTDGIAPFAFAYSPDGNIIASAGTNDMIVLTGRRESRLPSISGNIVQMRDTTTGEKRTTVSTQTQKVAAIIYTPNGKTIATTRKRDNTVYLWDTATGKSKGTLEREGSGSLQSSVYVPDRKTIMTAKLKTILAGHTSTIDSVAYSPNGKIIATAGGWKDNTVRLWDATTGETRDLLTGYTHISSVAYSPDGKTIAMGADYRSNALQLWDVPTRKLKTTYTEHTDGTLSSVVYSPDGRTIAAVGLEDNTVRLWSSTTGTHTATFKPVNTKREYDISSVAYSPDGQTIAVVGGYYKQHKGGVYLWHVQTRKRKIIYEGPDYISAVAYSPDGKTIATGSWNGNIQVWHTVTGEALKTISTKHKGGVNSLAYSPDGKTIATGGGYRDDIVQLWDAGTEEHKAILRGHTKTVSSVAYSPDGKTIASGSTDGTVRLWDGITGEHKSTFTAQTDIVSVVYSPDGQTMATRSTDGTVLLWETNLITDSD